MEILLGILILLSVLLLLGLISVSIDSIRNKFLIYEEFEDIATVSRIDYGDDVSLLDLIYDIFELNTGLNVYLEYEEEEYCISSEALFKEVELGETVFVTVHKGRNRQGEVKNVYLTIDED